MARSSFAAFMTVFLGLAPTAYAAETAPGPDLKPLQDKGATIVPLPELKRKLGPRMSFPKEGFICNRDICACSGVDDCLDMINSNVCADDPNKFNCAPGAFCVCLRN